MSANAKKAKTYFDKGLWNVQMLRNLVAKGFLTQEEFEAIVPEDRR